MELTFWHFKNVDWQCKRLKENVWLIELQDEANSLEKIHQLTNIISCLHSEIIQDYISAYESVTIFFDETSYKLKDVLKKISRSHSSKTSEPMLHEIPVCYELGMDWNHIESETGLSKDQIIRMHSDGVYTVAMLGFLPGFIFLKGLDERIHVPRRSEPRTKIESGSIGIGGHQTGIYSIESPGGWNIIGRTSKSLFNIQEDPPSRLKAGDSIKFRSISVDEFRRTSVWEN